MLGYMTQKVFGECAACQFFILCHSIKNHDTYHIFNQNPAKLVTSETVSIPVDVDVNEEVFEVVDGEAVEVGVRFVHFDGIEILVG